GVLSGRVEFSTDLFSVETVEAFVGHYRRVLECVAEDPDVRVGEIDFLSDRERDVLVSEWNDTTVEYPVRCLHEWFEDQVVQAPSRVAVVHNDVSMTYAELDARANRLAQYLVRMGVGLEDAVGVFVPRGVDLIVASLAVLKAGGAYLPLDPDYPADRLEFVLRDAGARVLLTRGDVAGVLAAEGVRPVLMDLVPEAREPSVKPDTGVTPEHAAYLIYTSGSTGLPKGTLIEHRSISNNLLWMQQNWPLVPSDGLLQKTACGFDVSVKELYWPLMFGARLVFADPDGHKDPAYLLDVISQHQVTVAHFVPSMLRAFLEQGDVEGARSLRMVMCGAEKLAPDLLQEFKRRLGADLLHMYGPTETTIAITGWLSSDTSDTSHTVPLGRPMDNIEVYVLDAGDRLAPIGVAGELCVSGVALARGYVNRPEETEKAFVANPYRPGERMYRTGDLVRYRRDGMLEFLGRRDQQVKVRGFRIELGEIETVLSQHPAVQQSVVTAHQHTTNDTRLTAYVRPATNAPEDTQAPTQQVAHWRGVFEKVDEDAAPADARFDITGWDSSYTWEPIPAAEMKEWVDTTVDRILEYRPRRVLEIGCGSGLLTWRIAPKCDSYVALDFSQVTLDQLDRTLSEAGIENVELFHREATDLTGVGKDFDVIVLNSVIQYFPELAYLEQVLSGARELLREGGVIFAGDVRHHGLLEPFHSSVEIFRSGHSTTVATLRDRVDRRIKREEELLVAPRYFADLAGRMPGVWHVEVSPRRGEVWNEMTAFRYDAVLHVGTPQAVLPVPKWLDWDQQSLSSDGVRDLLTQSHPSSVGVRDYPNPRLQGMRQALANLEGADGNVRLDDLINRSDAVDIAQGTTAGSGLEELYRVGKESGYRVTVNWSRNPDTFDVAFVAEQEAGDYPQPLIEWPSATTATRTAASPVANNPAAVHSQEQLRLELIGELRDFLAGRLPAYMVPSSFIVVDNFPLTPNGKIDQKALPVPDVRPDSAGAFVAPRNEAERHIAALWAGLLGVSRVGVEDDFFELGGHSLLAAQVDARVRKLFGVRVSVRAVFEYPTVAGLARAVARAVDEAAGEADEAAGTTVIVPRSGSGPVPLSFAQRRLWFLQQLDPSGVQYNLWSVLRLRGRLDEQALGDAVADIVSRHEVLRTTISVEDGDPVQVIHPQPLTSMEVTDVQGRTAPDEHARAIAVADVNRPFDLRTDAPIRTRLIRLAPDEHHLVISLHHIASDAWS
ncbi:non-ribosomal peptide synthetase, partial [Streptomyces anulatus]|uniref:non-ribosomal peptide synthetase n=1 Tax=Streptomyces anulatus TaxID=1892 RepID=UPI001C261724